MIMSMFQKKTCLFIEWTKLPKPFKELTSESLGFSNYCNIPMRSEFQPVDLAKGMIVIEDYWKHQKDTNGFEGTLQDFIENYGLQFEVWLIEQKVDLTGVDEILINVCW